MPISKEGLARVKKEHERALQRETEARRWLDQASECVDQLREALECDHDELENGGGFVDMTTTCKKCGFTWEE